MSDWILRLVEQLGLIGVALLMFLENLFPPIPSEVVMPLAGFVAGKGEFDIVLVIVAGTAGTAAGALFWYGVARRLGEARLRRWAGRHGRWITLAPDDIDRLSHWFERHRRWAIPLGHLVPGIRTLVSIPAGLFAMKLAPFVALTTIGAAVWITALALAGYALGSRYETVERYLGPASTAIVAAVGLVYLYRVVTFRGDRG